MTTKIKIELVKQRYIQELIKRKKLIEKIKILNLRKRLLKL